MTPGLSTQHGEDRLSLLHSCRLSDTQCHLQTHLFSSSLWQPPPHHYHHIHVVLGNQTLGANRMDAYWNASGSWALLLSSFLPLAVHWQYTRWLQSRCEDTHCTCHSSPGPLPCGTHTLSRMLPHPGRATPTLPHHTHRCSQSVQEPTALAGERNTGKRPGGSWLCASGDTTWLHFLNSPLGTGRACRRWGVSPRCRGRQRRGPGAACRAGASGVQET